MGSLHTQMLMRVFPSYQVMKLGSASRVMVKMMDKSSYLGKICFSSGMNTAEGSQNCCSIAYSLSLPVAYSLNSKPGAKPSALPKLKISSCT